MSKVNMGSELGHVGEHLSAHGGGLKLLRAVVMWAKEAIAGIKKRLPNYGNDG